MGIVPAAFGIFPGAALDFGLDCNVLILVAELGAGHDAIAIRVRVGVLGRGDDDVFDDGEVFLVGPYLLG